MIGRGNHHNNIRLSHLKENAVYLDAEKLENAPDRRSTEHPGATRLS